MNRIYTCLIFTLIITATSCGRHAGKSTVPVFDSTLNKSGRGKENKQQESTVDIKHEAYNEDVKDLPPALKVFVPEGYSVLDTTYGDLNLDSYTDLVMVLKKNGEDSTSNVNEHPEKRPLLLLTGQSGNTFKLAAKNDRVVYCIDCGGAMGDPFMDIVIKKGYFSVEHYGGSSWRWARTTTFKFSREDNYWFLHKDGHETFHASDPDQVKTKIYTIKDFGKVPFDQFDIYKE